MSPSQERKTAAAPSSEPVVLLAAVTLAILLARLFAAGYATLIENDEASLAAGIAAIVRKNAGDIYRYGPQLGYYRGVAWIVQALGGNVLSIPLVQVTISVVAGTLLPLLGYFAFREERTRLERWLTLFALAVNPLIWITSRYGNSAEPSVVAASIALVLLSNRPALGKEVLAFFCLGVAILVRADAVLVVPGVAMLLWRNHASIKQVVLRLGAVLALLGVVYALVFLFDARTRSIANDVADHLASESPTMFWEYLTWGTSPVLFMLAIVGARELAIRNRTMALALGVWVFPLFAFYFGATTQPRYFLLATIPLAIGSAAGMQAIVESAAAWRRLALGGVLALCSVHLLVGLGHFAPAHRRSYWLESEIATHTGPLWTGALLYKSYVSNSIRNAAVLHPRFGAGDRSGNGQTNLETASGILFDELKEGGKTHPHVLLIHEVHFGNVLHFYAQAASVQIVSKAPGPLWDKRFEMDFNGAHATMLGELQLDMDSTMTLPVVEGDEVWLVRRKPPALDRYAARMPPGLVLVPGGTMPDRRPTWRFRVRKGA